MGCQVKVTPHDLCKGTPVGHRSLETLVAGHQAVAAQMARPNVPVFAGGSATTGASPPKEPAVAGGPFGCVPEAVANKVALLVAGDLSLATVSGQRASGPEPVPAPSPAPEPERPLEPAPARPLELVPAPAEVQAVPMAAPTEVPAVPEPAPVAEPQGAAAPSAARAPAPTAFTHRKEWMAFTRASQNPSRTSAAWKELWSASGRSRSELFTKFIEANGDIPAVELRIVRERAHSWSNCLDLPTR